jgi:hypothetical protein
MPWLEDQIVALTQGRHDRVLCATNICKVGNSFKPENRFALFTEKGVDFFEPKGFGKSIALSRSFIWFDITEIKSIGPNSLELVFKTQSVQFQVEQLPITAGEILRHLRLILTPAEFPPIHVRGFAIPPPSSDPLCGYHRMRARILSAGQPVPNDLDIAYRLFLSSGESRLDLGEIPCGPHAARVLESLVVVPKVTKVCIPEGGDSLWESAGNLLGQNPRIVKFASGQVPDNGFSSFTKAVREKCSPALSLLSFNGTPLRLREIQGIASIYVEKPIAGLSISNGMDAIQMQAFFAQFAHPMNLRSLTFDNINNVDLETFFACLESFDKLGLTRCRLELSVFLRNAVRSKCFAVRNLDLSGNMANGSFGSTSRLPPSIRKITLNDMRFTEDVFEETIRFCLTAPSVTSLSLGNVGLARAEIEKILSGLLARPDMNGVRFAVTKFRWDDNPITPAFLRMVERCPDLRFLSLNGCLSGEDQSIQLVGEFLNVNTSVTRLSICGTTKGRLPPEELLKILEPFRRYNRTVTSLDLSNNSLDESTFEQLAVILIQNCVLTKVALRNFDLRDETVFEKFLRSLLRRGAPLTIPFPRFDLQEMIQSDSPDSAILSGILGRLEKVAQGDHMVTIPENSRVQAAAPPTPSYRTGAGFPTHAAVPSEAAARPAGPQAPPGPAPPPGEWDIVFESVPPIDKEALLREFQEAYTLTKLLQRVKGAA